MARLSAYQIAALVAFFSSSVLAAPGAPQQYGPGGGPPQYGGPPPGQYGGPPPGQYGGPPSGMPGPPPGMPGPPGKYGDHSVISEGINTATGGALSASNYGPPGGHPGGPRGGSPSPTPMVPEKYGNGGEHKRPRHSPTPVYSPSPRHSAQGGHRGGHGPGGYGGQHSPGGGYGGAPTPTHGSGGYPMKSANSGKDSGCDCASCGASTVTVPGPAVTVTVTAQGGMHTPGHGRPGAHHTPGGYGPPSGWKPPMSGIWGPPGIPHGPGPVMPLETSAGKDKSPPKGKEYEAASTPAMAQESESRPTQASNQYIKRHEGGSGSYGAGGGGYPGGDKSGMGPMMKSGGGPPGFKSYEDCSEDEKHMFYPKGKEGGFKMPSHSSDKYGKGKGSGTYSAKSPASPSPSPMLGGGGKLPGKYSDKSVDTSDSDYADMSDKSLDEYPSDSGTATSSAAGYVASPSPSPSPLMSTASAASY